MIILKKSVLLSTVIFSLFKKNSAFLTTMSGECSANKTSGSYVSGTHSVAYVTAPNEEIGKKLAHGLVSNKLAACVNLIPKITSIYEWEGKIEEDSEVLLMIKTRTSRIPELTEFVKKNHPYTVCEVISMPIANGNEEYLKWVGEIVPTK
ncbi:protein CutA homolog [Agrilus planipennis]|uniref:Protein CutA homolog n=1 Tax=Agrilus planipennis TaxID=224129 RepID=A0A1W4XPY1_AGRPL|nr:protein CutA homolog [Agrilus planipennis]